ncbi:MAG: hypothetical protein A3F84_12220 [Candidatus Handelsmanbacteria bacterium RIFCSPLOWO2_12_FULL_64_10]|uniref:Uncharacterized protein n=1 Tax=Handelsmanbacteria sp. (strain RIFCSPLOWO2_12_FULL_64_10) TaxID=1817868 RepID=A0A1F6C9P1_HANXR|nr:MAG: hypothetical protein A3F84_12220 [Candidatus Handelsmanbacteria bacterium RIFCSPLOWO2_12_FULL_64_10]
MSRPDFLATHQTDPYRRNLPYPRLFFSPEDIPALRARAGAVPGLIEGLKARADGHLAGPPLDTGNLYNGMIGAMARLGDLSAAYVLTGEGRYAEGTRAALAQAFDLPKWVFPVHEPMKFDHGSANVSAAVALALDFLGDAMTEGERSGYLRRLIERTAALFRRVYAERSERWVTSKFNWRSMICGDMGLALLTALGHDPDAMEGLTYALDGVLAILDDAPPDGEWGEGVGYWGPAVGLPIRLALAMDRMTEGRLDLFQHPYLRRTGDFLMHVTGPNGRVFAFADCGHALGGQAAAMLGLLGRKAGRPDWVRLALQYPPSSLFDLACTAGLSAPEAAPDPPTARRFETYEVVTLRSGWGPKDTFAALKGGPTMVGHSHLDINGFMVTALGETLIPDLGTWPYAHFIGFFDTGNRRWSFDANATRGHNTLLVDGQGQRFAEGAAGKVVRFEPGEAFDLVVSDGTTPYAPLLTRFHRWFLFFKPGLLVVFDDVRAEQARRVEWLLHYEGEAEAAAGVDLRVVKGDAVLDALFLLPGRDEGWVASHVGRRFTYRDSNRQVIVHPENRYVAFSRMHAYPDHRFLALLSFHRRGGAGWIGEVTASDAEAVRFTLRQGAVERRVTLDLEGLRAEVES